ncbi:MAG: FlgD immunoglobulin-like domain containing protein [Candidatus Krumholzibacteriia bacterium]
MPFVQQAERQTGVQGRHGHVSGRPAAPRVARMTTTRGVAAARGQPSVAIAVLAFLAAGPAAAGWGGGGFVQNVGQVPGGCSYYLNTPEYRLEVHSQELRIWLKEKDELLDVMDQEERQEPGMAHLVGYFLRIPLSSGPGELAVEVSGPSGPEHRVIKGSRHCRRAAGGSRLTIHSNEWHEDLALIAEPQSVLFERLATNSKAPRGAKEPWLEAGPEVRSTLASYGPIVGTQTRGVLVQAVSTANASADEPSHVQFRAAPSLLWSTFIGGESDDFARKVFPCEDGSVLLAGMTYSVGFPVSPGAYDTTLAYDSDGYVAKLSPDGGSLIWSSLIGGHDWDQLLGAVLTTTEEVVITGMTRSADFPTTPGAYDEIASSASPIDDIFVARFSANGDSLVWSTFIGGTGNEWAYSVDEDKEGNILVGGYSTSVDFPVTAGAYQTTHLGETWSADAVLAKLSGDGTSLLWATFIGGEAGSFQDDRIQDLAAMPDGTIIVFGQTHCSDFPVTPGSFQLMFSGVADLFVSRVSGDGHALIWSTFLGGSNYEYCHDMTVAPTGAIIVAGSTMSVDFPVTSGSFDEIPSQYYTGFVAKLADDGSGLDWSSYVGGQLRENNLPCGTYVWPVSVGDDGTVWVAGYTDCVDLPTSADGYDLSFDGLTGLFDAFVLGLSPDGASRVWGTYLGSTNDEAVRAMACDEHGRLILGVSAWSVGYPVTSGAYDTTHNSPGYSDAAVTVFRARLVPVVLASFTVRRQGATALIQWRLTEASNVSGFEVWRAGEPAQTRILVDSVTADAAGSYVIADKAPVSAASEYWLKMVSADGGSVGWYGPAVLSAEDTPERLRLSAALPNPFNPRTSIRFSLPRATPVTLEVYDQRGRLVRGLVRQAMAAGEQAVDWDGRDELGRSVPSGAYVVRLATEFGARTSKVTLAR